MTDLATAPAEMVRCLYPGSATPAGSSGPSRRTLVALPSLDRARMLLPAEPRLAASAMRRSRRLSTRRDRWTTAAVALALRGGAGRVVGERVEVGSGGRTVDDELSDLLGRPVVTSVFLGPPRANRKPVLQLIDPHGALVGVAKVGVTPLAARLALHEADVLRRLAEQPLGVVSAPRLVGTTEFAGFPVVVQSALPVWEQPPGNPSADVVAAMAEIATGAGTTRVPLGALAHREALVERAARLEDGFVRDTVTRVLREQVPDDLEVEVGAWHGDLSVHNLAATRERRVLVWDWERYETGVPVGFDVLHHTFLPLLRSRSDRPAQDLLAAAPRLLEPFGVDAPRADAVTRLYLATLATRFAGDGQARTGTAGGDVVRWLRPLVQDGPDRPRSTDG